MEFQKRASWRKSQLASNVLQFNDNWYQIWLNNLGPCNIFLIL